jgi:phage-related protein
LVKASPEEVESFQISLNLIGNFALSAQESKVKEISKQLWNVLEEIVANTKNVIKTLAERFFSYLDSKVSPAVRILEYTDIR